MISGGAELLTGPPAQVASDATQQPRRRLSGLLAEDALIAVTSSPIWHPFIATGITSAVRSHHVK